MREPCLDVSTSQQEPSQSFKQRINSRYGAAVLGQVRSFGKRAEKLARYKNHVNFNLRCKSSGVTPPSLRVKPPISTPHARSIANRASQGFLRERLRIAIREKHRLEEEQKWSTIGLQRALSDDDFQKIKRMTETTAEATFVRCRNRQVQKFNSLLRSSRPRSCEQTTTATTNSAIDKQKWIVNLSKHELSEEETNVLVRGLNFAPAPSRVPVADIIAGIEPAVRKHPDDATANYARAAVCNILRKARPPKPNTTSEERQALKNLRGNKSIIIVQADKGNATVVMDADDYEQKALTILQNPPFVELQKDPTKKIEREINERLRNFLTQGNLDRTEYDALRVSTGCSKPALFYGRPKIHKPEVPLRPIVSCVGTALYKTSKFLARLLRPLSGNTSSYIRNSADFCEKLGDTTIDGDEIMVSFDVRSLYTSIPINEALQVTKSKLEEDPSWSGSTSLTRDQIVALLETCLRKSNFKFRDVHYTMSNGLAMGSPVSAVIANLFMENFEQRAMAALTTLPKLWFRFVDDTFSIVKRRAVREILNQLNALDSNIQFTMELEDNGCLPFLDTTVKRLHDGKLETTVYRKATHTERYLSFSSHHPRNSKCNVVDTLLTRATTIVSDSTKQQSEIDHVKTVLTANGYPAPFIRQRELRLQRKPAQPPAANTRRQNQPKITAVIPFVDGTTQAIQRILRPLDIRVIGRSNTWKWSIQRDIKDATPTTQATGVVYEISCKDCPASYVGETGRALKVRLDEHHGHAKRGHPELSTVAEHAIDKNHLIDWTNPRILDRESKITNRRVKEALWISEKKPEMNKDKGLELNPMWIDLFRTTKK